MARSQLFDPQAIGMPANQRQQTSKSKSQSQAPLSPTSKATAKYTNKDGSKFITVPKSDASEIPAAMNQSTTTNGQVPGPAITNGVNKKKQKRREKEKEKARLASEQGGHAQPGRGGRVAEAGSQHSADRQSDENGQFDSVDAEPYSDEDVYSGSYGQNGSPPNGYSEPLNLAGTAKSKKKKKGKAGRSQSSEQPKTNGLYHSHHHPPPLNHPPPLIPSLQTNMPRGPGISREKIWNTSSQEERERIKEFWLSLGEDERKSLVKVEKDAVLKKMKEQQKHSCSCTVCGRKRTAIEEELEVLYDAYYEELEQYANHQGDGITPMVPPPRRFGAMSGLQPPNRLPPAFNGQQPSRGRIVEQLGDDEDDEGDEEYSDEDLDDDEFSDEDPEPEEIPRSYQTDFFNFGNSLTVQGGILTVADDLLKNDGKKFIEMMEQLAERRMAREEDARDQQAYFNNHPPNGVHNHTHTHNHPPPPGDEEYDDEEDEEDYDSQDEDYDDDEEELDTMTEEQRMEEGRRMFQIFAARMFEQRVLTAYKEKVAKERQQKLIEELEEESRASSQKKAKKAKDAQKKKDKARQKKQADAEKAAEEAAKKAAEDAARLAAEEKAREEQREREETKRRKKEEQRKAQEAEKLKKEADKKRRADEAREIERKQREAKERKAAAAAAEREKREREEREIKERKAAAEREKREKDAKIKAEKEAKQREEVAAQQAAAKAAIAATQIPKRPLVPIPSNLQPQAANIVSPLVPVATPVVPKAPTPSRLRTASQQESSGSSVPQTPQTGGMSQNVSPVPTTPLHGSPGPIGPPGKGNPQPHLYHPQATSPMHAALKGPPGMQPNPFAGMPPLNMGFQPQPPMMGPGFGPRQMHFDPIFPHQQMGGQFRPMVGPNGMPIHPAMNMHHMPQGRGFPVQNPPPGFPQSPNGFGGIGQAFGVPKDAMPGQSHSRNPSASFEMPTTAPQAQPIARPAPIGRPSSVVNGQHQRDHFKNEVDDLSNALGSSALIDDSDEPFSGAGQRRTSGAPGNMNRQAFPPTPFGMDQSTFASPITPWGGQGNPFGPSSLPSSNYMGGWPQSANSSFGGVGAVGPISGSSIVHPSQPRPAVIRSMICRACKILEGSTPDGFYSVSAIKEQIDHFNPAPEPSVSEQELVTYSSGTEGNSTNGGGYLEVREDSNGHQTIRHEIQLESQRPVGAPGEIGSPIISAGSGRFGPPPGF